MKNELSHLVNRNKKTISKDTSSGTSSKVKDLNADTSKNRTVKKQNNSTGTSTDTSTNKSKSINSDQFATLEHLQREILSLDTERQMKYDAKDLKYASWQFPKEVLNIVKKRADTLNVHQSQLMRYIVDRALKEYL